MNFNYRLGSINMMMALVLVMLLCIATTTIPMVSGFVVGVVKTSPLQQSTVPRSRLLSLWAIPEERKQASSGDFPPEEDLDDATANTSSIDWDAEWKKVVANQNQPVQRPGKDFYKSEAEIAAIKAANRATREIEKLRPPSFQSLQGDWKFWIAVLAIISVGASLLSGGAFSQPSTSLAGPDSYYI